MNKVMLIGNLTRDPEVRTLANGNTVCSFGLAVQRRFSKDQAQRETDFFNITVWGQLGDLCARYLTKGRKAAVTGRIQIRNYDGNDGTKKTAVDIIADEVEFLGTGSGSETGATSGSMSSSPAPRSNAPAHVVENGMTEIDEDLPF